MYSWPALKPLTVLQAWRAIVIMIRGPARPASDAPARESRQGNAAGR